MREIKLESRKQWNMLAEGGIRRNEPAISPEKMRWVLVL
jgi:hypothetical protein